MSPGRATVLTPDAHRLYRAIVDSLVTTGAPPDGDTLAWATGFDLEEVERLTTHLIAGDWLGLDAADQIAAVYPFALYPSDIAVRVDDQDLPVTGAIDALGVAPLLARDVTITSRCPSCDASIRVAMRSGRIALRHPASTIVVRLRPDRSEESGHSSRRDDTRFACSPDHGREWLDMHGGPQDVLISLESAFIEARVIYAEAYTLGRSAQPTHA